MATVNQSSEEWSVPLPEAHEYLHLCDQSLSEIEHNDPAFVSADVFMKGDRQDWALIGRTIGKSRVLKNLSVVIEHDFMCDIRQCMLPFFDGMSNNRSIQTLKLNFRMSDIMGEAFTAMHTFFESNTNLLRLDSTSYMPSRQTDGFVRAISVNSSLRHINVYGVHATGEMAEAICSRPNLSHLTLQEEFGRGTCEAINKLLTKQNSTLRVLELDGMMMSTNDSPKLLTSGLAANASLEHLTLRSASAVRGYRPVSSIFKTLQLTQLKDTLHTLQLGGTRNDVRWGNAIGVLRCMTALNTLILDHTEIEKNGFMIWGNIFDAVLGPSSTLQKLSARSTSMKLDSLRDLVSCMNRTTSLRVLDLSGSRDLADDPFPSSFNTIWPSLFNTVRSTGCPLLELNIKGIFLSPENIAALATFLRRSDNTLKTFIGYSCFGSLPDAIPLTSVEKFGFRSIPSGFAQKLLDAPSLSVVSLSIGEVPFNELQELVTFLSSPHCSLVEFVTCLDNVHRRHSRVLSDNDLLQVATDLATGLRINTTMKRLHIALKQPLNESVAVSIRAVLSNLLYDSSSFQATKESNHTLEDLRFGSILSKCNDVYLALQLNKIADKRAVATEKILRNNASFSVDAFDVKVLPNLISWMGKYPVGFRNIYSVVHQVKDLFHGVNHNAGHAGKRKRE